MRALDDFRSRTDLDWKSQDVSNTFEGNKSLHSLRRRCTQWWLYRAISLWLNLIWARLFPPRRSPNGQPQSYTYRDGKFIDYDKLGLADLNTRGELNLWLKPG